MAVASTMSNHIILIGLGHLGYRIVQKLNEMGENIVVIELNPSVDTFSSIQAMNIPVIQDDATRAHRIGICKHQRGTYDYPREPK